MIGYRQIFDLTETELDVGVSAQISILSCFGQHLGSHINTDNRPSWTDLLGGKKAVDSSSAAEINDHFFRPQFGERNWIATS